MKAKLIGLIAVFMLASTPLFSAFKIDIYNAFLNNDMNKWKTVIDKMEKRENITEKFRMELINYQYGYIGYCIEEDKDDEAEEYIELAQAHIELLEESNTYASDAYAYKAALYGFQISISGWKAPVLGPKSMSAAEKALEKDSTNPTAYVQLANIQYYMPSSFGGSKTKAISYYKKALKLMEKNSFTIKNNWNYLSLLTILGQAYEDTGKPSIALRYYSKALKKEPRYSRMKTEYIPRVKKKIKK